MAVLERLHRKEWLFIVYVPLKVIRKYSLGPTYTKTSFDFISNMVAKWGWNKFCGGKHFVIFLKESKPKLLIFILKAVCINCSKFIESSIL